MELPSNCKKKKKNNQQKAPTCARSALTFSKNFISNQALDPGCDVAFEFTQNRT